MTGIAKQCTVGHFKSTLTYFLGLESPGLCEFAKELGKIVAGELPLKGPCRGFPIVLKIEDPFRELIEISEIIGRKHFPLQSRSNFDLIEPAGVNRSMNEGEARVETP